MEHYYIVRSKVDESLFVKLVEQIPQYGCTGEFHDEIYTYFEKDGFIY
jgi:hypothetical protein